VEFTDGGSHFIMSYETLAALDGGLGTYKNTKMSYRIVSRMRDANIDDTL
jgi:hypothetical protein